jgi:MinD-like ATPase involved in chromosome partitioning or flagellar assembly
MGVGHEGGPGYRTFPPVGSTGPATGPVPARRPAEPSDASTTPAASTSSLPKVPRTGAPPVPAGGPPATTTPSAPLPTLTDLLAARPVPPAGPAELGWQATVRRLTGGLIAPAPGRAEQEHRAAVAAVQRSLEGPKTVVVLNPKGGAHKTTATLLIAATFGLHRGGYTLAWDNNETRGTLGWRSQQSRHHNTALNLLQDLDRFSDPSSARVGDLDNYVRSQGSAQFDVLASDEDAASAASIDAFAFRSLHRTLSRFYRVMVIDTGNNMRASNWQAAVEAADQVVIVSTVREDTAQSAAWAVDALRATGHEDVVRRAVTVLSAPAPQRDDRLADRLHEHFGRLTRTVLDVPYDPSLVAGRPLDYDALSRQTREAWLQVTAAVADGL